MTAAEILEAAAKRLETVGWLQGSYCPLDQSLRDKPENIKATDVTGALRLAGGGHWVGENDDAIAEAKEALRAQIGGGSLADWNDDKKRTKEQVIAKLMATAKICKKERFKPVHEFPWGPGGMEYVRRA